MSESIGHALSAPKARRRRAARKRVRRAGPEHGRRDGTVAARPELNEASRALLGDDPERRTRKPRSGEEGSVEDPLRDWPEDA
jgi:hypothetical protein